MRFVGNLPHLHLHPCNRLPTRRYDVDCSTAEEEQSVWRHFGRSAIAVIRNMMSTGANGNPGAQKAGPSLLICDCLESVGKDRLDDGSPAPATDSR